MDIIRNITPPDVSAKRQLIVAAMHIYKLDRPTAIKMVSKAYKKLDTKDQVIINFNSKDKNGDMQQHTLPIEQYVSTCIKTDTVMVPSWTTYDKNLNIAAPEPEIVEGKMIDRGIQKKKTFKALMANDMGEYNMQYTMQINSKTVSNALSGGVCVGGTCVQNPSSHTTSTSTARAATSTPNGAIERFISGLMHFKDPNSVIGYMTAIVMTLDEEGVHEKYAKAVDDHDLTIPTVLDIEDMLKESTKDYWIDDNHVQLIIAFIAQVSDMARVAIYYNGSLKNLYNLNSTLIETWLIDLGSTSKGVISDGDLEYVSGIDDVMRNTLAHLFNPELKGLTIPMKEYEPQLLADMHATIVTYKKNIDNFDSIIDVFFKPLILTPNVGDYKEMVRDAVIVNDTDSGIFHLGIWIEILLGDAFIINDQSRRYCGVFAHLTNIVYTHAMDILTLNMNVHNHEKRNINMKSEFTFSMLALPSASKHYFAEASIIEGNVLPIPKLEQKGVGLRSAATPQIVRTISMDMEKDISLSLQRDGCLDLYKYLDVVVALEKVIEQGALTSADYYTTVDIKSEDAQNVIWADLWNNTKMGRDMPITIPCGLIKIPTTLTNKTTTTVWLDSIEDKELSDGIRKWMDYGVKNFEDHPDRQIEFFSLNPSVACPFSSISSSSNLSDAAKIISISSGITK